MRKGTPWVWVTLAIFFPCTVLAQTTSTQLDRLVRASSLIFVGKVEEPGATTTDEVAADSTTAIVSVEDV